MLMECLAVGRGISLPASANASAKAVTLGVFHYLRHRKQFRMPIGDMEAVREKCVRMFCNAWIINASVHMTNTILDHGAVPSVLTAVMKQQSTERARAVLQDGMDLCAGSAICVGENNFFTRFYHSAPVGITVEGSNTLTRGLIIFGQGLNKSHPHIHEIVDCLYSDKRADFERYFYAMLGMVIRNYAVGIVPLGDRLRRLAVRFSTVASFVALLGGQIKSRQMMSGDMADALSAIYLAEAVLWYHEHQMKGSASGATAVRDRCIGLLCDEAEQRLTAVINNYPGALRALLLPFRYRPRPVSYADTNRFYQALLDHPALVRELSKDVYTAGTILEKLERLSALDGEEYRGLVDEVIRVGEWPVTTSPGASGSGSDPTGSRCACRPGAQTRGCCRPASGSGS
ncbi:DUF1974 domain-containing protein [bacterium]|nr:DUF1974 domain-containing protein [bacterium]